MQTAPSSPYAPWASRDGRRHMFAALAGMLAAWMLLVVAVKMNRPAPKRDDAENTQRVLAFAPVQKAKPKPRAIKPKPKKKAKPKARSQLKPQLSQSLAGQAFGLDSLLNGLSDLADGLAADGEDVVMTAEAVDTLPQAKAEIRPIFPARARAQGIVGHVLLSLLVDASGRVDELEVLEAEPEGVFEKAAMAAYRQARFEPAMYQGKPQTMRVEAMVAFDQE